jgi:hypothetical protein
MPELPDAVALGQKAIADDQRRGLDRAQDLQPDSGYHKPHRESGETGCESADKGGKQKQSKHHAIHDSSLQSASERCLDGDPS